MKSVYKGYEITVTKEICMGGWSMLYYSIFRLSDGYECLSSCEDSAETVKDMVKYMKERIDNEHSTDDPWGEKESENELNANGIHYN